MSTHLNQKKVRRTFFYLLLLFLVPLLLASWMAVKHQYLPAHSTQHGQLLQPPLNISLLPLAESQSPWKGRWLLLYVNPNHCDKTCEKALYDMRQIRTATGKDMDRVQRGILTFAETGPDPHLKNLLIGDFNGTLHLVVARKTFEQLVQNNPSEKIVLKTGGIYVVDPLGNMMMFYSLTVESMGIFKDLTRLLKLSHIG